MDISFGSPIGLNSPFSPKTRQSVTSKRSSLLTNFRNQSKFNISGRINHNAQTIFKTAHNTAENYGLPLPVLVTETLTFADSSAQISARLSPAGWAWVVCGRKLLVWQYREARARTANTTATVTCYELTLPQTDLAHKADLVCVYTTDGNQAPSCIGVSPEGVIRYWSSVGHEGSYWEEEADLRGQECDSLREVQPTGCVLATTTCTVVLVQPVITGGRHGIVARTLRGSGGWLGGISRRVSSLFFSAMPSSHTSEMKLVGIAALGPSAYEEGSQSPGGQPGGARVCLVAGLHAQLWGLGAPEGLTAEADLQRTLRDAFLKEKLFPQGDPGMLDVFILDIQPWNDGLLLLTSAVNTLRSPLMRYALVHMCVEEGTGGVGRLLGLVPLAPGVGGGGEGPVTHGAIRLMATPMHAYLYTKNSITVVSCVTPNEKPDIIEFNTNGDQILGGGLSPGTPLFFSKTHGVISITPNDSPLNDTSLMDSPLASPRPSDAFYGQLSFYELDPRAVGPTGAPATELLKAAFLHHFRREHAASRTILSNLFPVAGPDGEEDGPDVDTLLDRTLLTMATDLVNDVPASDPRWNQSGGAALGSSSSMQITAQLQDKRRALSLLLDWARGAGLWARLGGASEGGGRPAPTVLLLRELAEKVAAAGALRALQQQTQHQHVVDTAIHQVMSNSAENEEEAGPGSSALSPSDLFYKRVTGVQRALIRACCWCAEQEESGCEPPALSMLISKVNQVILAVLQEVLKFRQQSADQFSISPAVLKLHLEHTTWTSNPRSSGLLSSLLAQQSLSVLRARRASPAVRGELRSQGAALGSVVLQLAQERNQSRGANKEYARIRTSIIQPYVDDEEYEHATTLAEKFHDFEMLVLICEKSNNREKLYHYMEKFENQGFQQCAFRWFMVRGRGGQAALLKAFPRHAAALSHWLARHQPISQTTAPLSNDAPALSEEEDGEEDLMKESREDNVEGSELLWLHEVRNGRWIHAATTLLQLSQIEQQSVHRMNIQASLSKLCALAAEGGGDAQERKVQETVMAADQRILLKDYHSLPPPLMAHHGLSADSMRVMEPRDIVDMYITYPGLDLTEYDYVRALELCSLVLGEVADVRAARCEVAELRRRVWCSTLLADTWSPRDAEEPLQTLQSKMFFKVVDAVHLLDCNLDEYLIPLEDLMSSPELSDLVVLKVFQYIMKFGYEHVYRSQAENMASD